MAKIRHAVFPAAGLGTRLLPAAKAQPEEIFPLADNPVIQYSVEQAVASGIDNLDIVTGSHWISITLNPYFLKCFVV
jgi:UTP--glucose-1-phosphate uridylyltransferase